MNIHSFFRFLFFAICMSGSVLQAQDTTSEKQRQKNDLRKEMKAYFQKEILPFVKAERAKFDPQLSAEDRNQIDVLRKKAATLREQGKKFRKNHFQNRQKGEKPSEEQRQSMHQFHRSMHRIYAEAWLIADKYDAQLQQIAAQSKAKRETWQADIRKMMQNRFGADSLKGEGRHGKHSGKGRHGRHFGSHHGFGKMHKLFSPAAFILLDPNSQTASLMEEDEDETNSITAPASVFPNPALENSNTLAFELKEEGTVKIELLDKDGKLIRSLLDEKREKGTHTLPVNLNELKTGIYYYRIQSSQGDERRKFIKE
jgi:Secretion system C-terminal sorting domain